NQCNHMTFQRRRERDNVATERPSCVALVVTWEDGRQAVPDRAACHFATGAPCLQAQQRTCEAVLWPKRIQNDGASLRRKHWIKQQCPATSWSVGRLSKSRLATSTWCGAPNNSAWRKIKTERQLGPPRSLTQSAVLRLQRNCIARRH